MLLLKHLSFFTMRQWRLFILDLRFSVIMYISDSYAFQHLYFGEKHILVPTFSADFRFSP